MSKDLRKEELYEMKINERKKWMNEKRRKRNPPYNWNAEELEPKERRVSYMNRWMKINETNERKRNSSYNRNAEELGSNERRVNYEMDERK